MALVFACGRCKTPLKDTHEPESNSVIGCPTCGENDTFENVQRIIGEFMQEQAAEQFSDMLRGVARRSKALAFNEAPRPKGVYRFIAIDDGH
jgi:hypothetical protein